MPEDAHAYLDVHLARLSRFGSADKQRFWQETEHLIYAYGGPLGSVMRLSVHDTIIIKAIKLVLILADKSHMIITKIRWK